MKRSQLSNTHGGARAGAGRKRKDPTVVKRIPLAIVPIIDTLCNSAHHPLRLAKEITSVAPVAENRQSIVRPLFSTHVPAGFPSPADDYIECGLDLNELLIKHPSATFFVRVSGDSMIGAGIYDGDILTVDRALQPVHGNIVIAIVSGELTVKRLYKKNNSLELHPENETYPIIKINIEDALEIWGVVTSAVRQF